uniref:Si:dkey-85k7.12 n=1 Tax=Neogobius melanostomus TaxID=47308 RepID=A0A8C6US85_9GOBI
MQSVLERLGLQEYYKRKLSLERLLQIDHKATAETPPDNNDVVWFFIKKLMLVNVTARNVKLSLLSESCSENLNDDDILDLDALVSRSISEDKLSLHDIITALFLCSDGFVQQELSLKMSMCQFAVPLLLPNCDSNQCTLMLWALRDIVKKYRPKSLSEAKGFKEETIVQSEIPMITFVRLGDSFLSKSEILNKLLSNSQQYHDTFVHRDMEGGDCPRTISNGLAEITWYLPCGKKNIDIFDEPVAVVNLRGDIASFETQYAFLCQASSAVFVFLDCVDSKNKPLITTKGKTQMFLVADQKSKNFCLNDLKWVAGQLQLKNTNILLKTKTMNDADFVQNVQKTMRSVIKDTGIRMSLEQMASIAHELGICVDEDRPECQKAKQNADAVTEQIEDIPRFKKELKKVGSQNIDVYKARLRENKKDLRHKQNSYDISAAMACFINSLSGQSIERLYFLKWMRINLDNLSRKKLSGLREQYKEMSKKSDNKEVLKRIDVQLSDSSLGTENFIREMSQIYEASLTLSESDLSRKQFQHLPRLCAQLLLDGFPLELVDGDASNIPLRWVSDVLAQLNELVSPNNKILVVTVLGVQSTGKSTLLNTMFGVQFAVSSGRCTRGAFIEDMKTNLNCDFLVIIDTEGLKSQELATLENSYEHDNELATLVVGLSDITIINIAMENSTEMKDILQIVVHAFLRMKEIGKKPKCQFVHQNVSDVSAHEKNLRDRKVLLQQLNEMTQAAAKMERKEKYKSFTDVMDYDPDSGNWYIPGLWNGSPPMAPVNAGYSEAVYELKENVIQLLEKCDSSANTVLEFHKWIESLWTAVKHENFIFSFRNSLVADAYMKLCTAYNQWEWEFKTAMYTWSTNAETKIKNFGMGKVQSDIETLVNGLKLDMQKKLSENEATLLNNLKAYFKKKEGHVYLVESYRTEFENSAKSLGKQLKNSVTNQIIARADIKRGMADVERIKRRTQNKSRDKCIMQEISFTKQTRDLKEKAFKLFWIDIRKHLQSLADKIIDECDKHIENKVAGQSNYHDTYIEEILRIIDDRLRNEHYVHTEFEVSLKQHISAIAARRFQQMHNDFLDQNDPHRCLLENKVKFHQCLGPAVEDYIKRFLGSDIVAEMQTSHELKERMSFQRAVLEELLQKDAFSEYLKYTRQYEAYVKDWIRNRIRKCFPDSSHVSKFEEEHVNVCIRLIKNAITKAQEKQNKNIKEFVENICTGFDNKLVIEQNALNSLLFLNIADKKMFVKWLIQSVDEMGQTLKEKLSRSRIEMKLSSLSINPLNELYKKLIGCGKQCPFCNAPCEAGARDHTQHSASLHRPQAFHACRYHESGSLVSNICSTDVNSDLLFSCNDTKGEWHPYKRYREIYPDWKIMPDSSYEASDCWKYVLAKFNNEFAAECNAKPADIPEPWKSITKHKL